MISLISHIISNVWRDSYVGLIVPHHCNMGSLVAMEIMSVLHRLNLLLIFFPCGNKG